MGSKIKPTVLLIFVILALVQGIGRAQYTIISGSRLPLAAPTCGDVVFGIHNGVPYNGTGGTTSKFPYPTSCGSPTPAPSSTPTPSVACGSLAAPFLTGASITGCASVVGQFDGTGHWVANYATLPYPPIIAFLAVADPNVVYLAGGNPTTTGVALVSTGGTDASLFNLALTAPSSVITPGATSAPTASPSPTPSPVTYDNAVLADAPLVYLKMNDASPGPFLDSSGNSYPITNTAPISYHQTALTSYLAPYSAAFQSSGYATDTATWAVNTVTAECWINVNSTDLATNISLIGNYWGPVQSSGGFDLTIEDGTPKFYYGARTLNGGSNVTAGLHHLVGEWNGTNAYTYLDGVQSSTSGVGPVGNVYTANTASPYTYWGAIYTSGGIGFQSSSKISNCALYTTGLPAARVLVHYDIGTGNPTPSPSPSPVPNFYAPNTGVYGGQPIQKAICINNGVSTSTGVAFLNILPTSPPSYGSASGDPIGEFADSGYTTSLLQANWEQTQTRQGTVGASFGSVIAHLASPLTLPSPGATISVVTDTAAPSGVTLGSTQVSIGYSAGQNGNVVSYPNTAVDPVVIVGTVTADSSSTWTLSNAQYYYQLSPAPSGTSIPVTSPAYGTATKISVVTPLSWPGYDMTGFGHSNGNYSYWAGGPGDGTSQTDPHAIATDSAVAGNPQGLAMTAAIPNAANQWPNKTVLQTNDGVTYNLGYVATTTTSSISWPAAGSTFSLPVADTTAIQNSSGDNGVAQIGTIGSGKVGSGFVSGGCDHNTGSGCTGGPHAGTLTIYDFQYSEGSASGTFTSGSAVTVQFWKKFYVGSLDWEFPNCQYCYVVAKERVPWTATGNPAFWTINTQTGYAPFASGSGGIDYGLARFENDIQESFGYGLGENNMNAGDLLWNRLTNNAGGGVTLGYYNGGINGGVMSVTGPDTSYHTYGSLTMPGGGTGVAATPSPDPAGTPIPNYDRTLAQNGNSGQALPCNAFSSGGQSEVLDGTVYSGENGCGDPTLGAGSQYEKELMATFQTVSGIASADTGATVSGAGFTIPTTVGQQVTFTIANTSTLGLELGNEYEICNSTNCTSSSLGTATAYMHCMLVGYTGSSMTCALGGETSPANTTGTMASGSHIIAADGVFAAPFPQTWWLDYIRVYQKTASSCT